jgi:hypothetical protein
MRGRGIGYNGLSSQLMSHYQWQHHTIDDSKSDTYHVATTLLLESRRLRARAPGLHRRILCTKGRRRLKPVRVEGATVIVMLLLPFKSSANCS